MAKSGDTRHPDSPPPPRFELVTLGAVALVRPSGELILQKSKFLALLAYVLASPTRTATRSQLAALLWGDSSPERAGRALRTTLFRLREALGIPVSDRPGGEIRLRVPITSDFEVFFGAIQAGDLEHAIGTYTGPFFPEYSDAGTVQFEHWADLERERLHAFFLRTAETLVERRLAEGRAKEAARIARRVRTLAPAEETGWRLLLESLIATRDELAYRAETEAFAAWLARQDRKPEAASIHLLEEIRSGRAASEPAESGNLASEMVERERELSEILEAWSAAARGNGTRLHLRAPAGFGKTRLLDEVASRLKVLGASVVRVRATLGEPGLDYAMAAVLAQELATAPGSAGVAPASIPMLLTLQPALASRFPGYTAAGPVPDLTFQRAQALAGC